MFYAIYMATCHRGFALVLVLVYFIKHSVSSYIYYVRLPCILHESHHKFPHIRRLISLESYHLLRIAHKTRPIQWGQNQQDNAWHHTWYRNIHCSYTQLSHYSPPENCQVSWGLFLISVLSPEVNILCMTWQMDTPGMNPHIGRWRLVLAISRQNS